MEKKLLKCLVDFYSKLACLDNNWKELSKSNEKVLNALRNQVEQLRHVTSSEVDNAELFKIEGLRDQLIFKIHAGIDEEIVAIYDTLTQLNNDTQDLKNRLINLERTRSKLSLDHENMSELVNGTTRRPKLNLLLEWAIDACDYYQNIYYRINNSLKALDYKDEQSIQKLAGSFIEKEMPRTKIDRILAYTQFLAQETC
ncbi:PREDICTED: uncharacterized protein LOC105367841 [Ceratosolen solmsi marchali]|uniref:Uncharacterized protein LOC105367841 n=1 Tax=Ceratosolen solmsi marchali TaxID=326594 RepID=A0AAJ6YV17_9HYME|nr:PREDICTED: uncharacterized protein LOC105367841 [Ceratosolen solmsi marchali]